MKNWIFQIAEVATFFGELKEEKSDLSAMPENINGQDDQKPEVSYTKANFEIPVSDAFILRLW